ncbi:SDR family oxidoreductase [Deinococcus apachensis]|uniref:SDR family oxidoreductase n=1 Tax=Deinococcus apachensis TaxID=309886 RepID=UPI0003714B99|nr:SDR family oxidoreductase [Deinococcus apachensis]
MPDQIPHAPSPPLAGRRVLITGGTTGIGLAVAHLLVRQHARVFVVGRRPSTLEAALHNLRAAGGEVQGLPIDTVRLDDLHRLFQEIDRWGGLDVLVNNASVRGTPFWDEDARGAEHLMQVNAGGYVTCAHLAARRMREHGGHIVNVGSLAAEVRDGPYATYVAAKSAVRGFSMALGRTVRAEGIRVSLIEPGFVDTPMIDVPVEEKQQRKKRLEMLEPRDVAEAVLFCLTRPPGVDIPLLQIQPLR